MALKDEILKALLTEKEYISGERLARRFGKSRAGVWKAIKSLRADGYRIDAVTNKGYMLSEKNEVYSARSVSARLKRKLDVIYFPSIDSTNTYCKKLIAQGREGEFLVVAEEQTAGRGRQGKSFYSPAKTGVYFSLVIRPDMKLSSAVTVTSAAAVAVCRALEGLTDITPQIKWVNDVFVDGKKVCGILTEAVSDFESGTVDAVIVGIGINIKTADFPEDVEGAGCIDVNISRSELVAAVINELFEITLGDYSAILDYYRSHSMLLGKRIKFMENSRVTEALAVAIDERGGLVVRLDDGVERTLRSGEISVRR